MFDNDESEYLRREHLAEMGTNRDDDPWDRYTNALVADLVARGITTHETGLDGDQKTDGFSIDSAFEAYQTGVPVFRYVKDVEERRRVRSRDEIRKDLAALLEGHNFESSPLGQMISTRRGLANANFKDPQYQGQRGEDWDNGFMDAVKVIAKAVQGVYDNGL